MKMASDTLRRRHCKKIGEEDMDVGQAGGDVGEFNASQVGGEGDNLHGQTWLQARRFQLVNS